MKKKKDITPIPKERKQTVRQEIVALLTNDLLSVGELSRSIGKSEKEIFEQLSQIQKSTSLTIEAAECQGCGFVFEDRTRLKKPGKCPKCRSRRIFEPRFTISGT